VSTNIHNQKPKLLLADDHAIVIEGLRKLLQPEFELVGVVGVTYYRLENIG
jgi:DNA-binding NarL/FixJ family response regulator